MKEIQLLIKNNKLLEGLSKRESKLLCFKSAKSILLLKGKEGWTTVTTLSALVTGAVGTVTAKHNTTYLSFSFTATFFTILTTTIFFPHKGKR